MIVKAPQGEASVRVISIQDGFVRFKHGGENDRRAFTTRHRDKTGAALILKRLLRGRRLGHVPAGRFVRMEVCAAEKWNLVEHVLLEPFEPEINHRRDE